ncbi:unnamed protein product [Penicillium olsonii]|uniref:Ankyrin n=1 Tax=Penicillium olsonii TaxID=99116 RepID=A0A9W4HUC7_PENOL|nr:unnamed protein product [Penicillium olsonii]
MEVTKSLVIHTDTSLSPSALSLTLDSPHKEVAIVKDMNLRLMKCLGSIIPWNINRHSPILSSASRTSAALSVILPANEPGQHDIPSANLNILRTGIRDSMGLAFYLISNNLNSTDGHFDKTGLDDKLYLQILKDIGWDDIHHLRILLSSCEPTVESITERLFAAAVRSYNFEVAQKMLRAGMDPNLLLKTRMKPCFTPLQYIASDGDNEFINLLVSHGADVNFSVNDSGRNALFYAIWLENWTAVRLLRDNGATVTRQCAELLTEFAHVDHEQLLFMKDMIGIYLDQSVGTQQDETKTLLPAVSKGCVDIVQLFITKGARLNELVTCSTYGVPHQTTLLGRAVKNNFRDIIRLLLHVSPPEDLSLIHPPYISPLALAVDGGSVDIFEDLLSSGADLRAADEGQKTLLERAVRNKNLALCQMLINHGVKVDREPQEAQWYPLSALMIAVQQDLMDIVDLLIASNARLNDTFEGFPCTVLTAAFEAGNVAMIENLENAGATRLGREIRGIGNLQSAVLLSKKVGFQRILDRFGSSILTAAILAKDEPLAWFLLQRIAPLNQHTTITDGERPLSAAIQTDNIALVLALLERGVQVTDLTLTDAVLHDNTPLLPILLPRLLGNAPTAVSAAVLKFTIKCLEILREADVGFTGAPQMSHHRWARVGRDGLEHYCLESTLEIATLMADQSMFKYLLEWATSTQTNWCRSSVARALTLAIFYEKLDRVFDLMQLDSNINISITRDPPFSFHGKIAFTPLQAAVRNQLVPVVRDLLVLKRADVNYLGDGKLRRTPLQHAVELGNMEIFGLLLKHGADVNAPAAKNGGVTALQIAAIKGFTGIARRLLDLGADVNQAPAVKNGRTALGGAAEYGRIDMLQMLLNEGALVVGEYEDQYLTAVKLAEERGHYAAARLLRSFKESVELAA